MTHIRPPAVAGLFYPDDARSLRAEVRRYLDAARAEGAVPKAVIAPHAGFIYSGPVAASAYARLMPARGKIRRVVLLGPAHRVGFRGLAAVGSSHFATPLGNIAIDQDALAAIADLPQVRVFDEAHRQEHSLEVHLPFLQEVLATPGMDAASGHPGPLAALLRPWRAEVEPRREQRPSEFTLVPLVVGEADAAEVAEVLERLWGGPETLIVISSDLSHYHDYDTAKRLDAATSRAIEQLRYEDIDYDGACGRNPVSGLLHYARRHGMKVRMIDLRNSGDTAGPRDRVVGYGAYVLE